jgi:hypothetical protein
VDSTPPLWQPRKNRLWKIRLIQSKNISLKVKYQDRHILSNELALFILLPPKTTADFGCGSFRFEDVFGFDARRKRQGEKNYCWSMVQNIPAV